MKITKFERTIFPQTAQGKRMADEFIEKLKNQGAFDEMHEDTQCVDVKARYVFCVKDEVGE